MATVKAGEPVCNPSRSEERSLGLYVIFTDLEATRQAVNAARSLARDLGACPVLVMAQVVPYPLPLDCSPLASEFTECLIGQLAGEQATSVWAHVHLCRDRNETIRRALGPGSLVVIGVRRHRWRNPDRVLTWILTKDGHHVIPIEVQRVQPFDPRFARHQTMPLRNPCKPVHP